MNLIVIWTLLSNRNNKQLKSNSNMSFLRNEFSKIFEYLLTMTLFTEMTHKYKIKLKTWDWPWWNFETCGCKMFFGNLLKLNLTQQSLPTAWKLNVVLIANLLLESRRILSKRFWFSVKLSVVEIFCYGFYQKIGFGSFDPKFGS